MAIEMRRLGRTDLKVTSCCLGTMTWGEQNSEAEGHAQMDYARDRGINFFDTAELYPIPPKADTQGATERIIGTWLKARGQRDQVVIASKVVGRSQMTWHRSSHVDLCRLDQKAIDEAVEGSLKRLQTDYIDLYQLHWPDRVVPMFGQKPSPDEIRSGYEAFEETLGHLDRHVQAGRIRHIGVSNETPFGVMRFLTESDARGLPRMQSIQNVYSLVSRKFEEGLDEIAMHEQVGLLAYSPLAQGFLTGKYRDGALPPGSRKALFQRTGRYETPNAESAINAYLDLATRHGIDPAHLALKFCDTRPFMTSTIIGATNMDQLRTNIDAFDLDWTDTLESAVNAIDVRYPSPCP
jgi:aryl-alcohol dehydrogenase-like predicted oxidoreductase